MFDLDRTINLFGDDRIYISFYYAREKGYEVVIIYKEIGHSQYKRAISRPSFYVFLEIVEVQLVY